MIAIKIFNNNSVLAKDHKGKEVILLGGGLGFGIHKNDEIDEKKIEKIFRLDKATTSKFQKIVQETPMQIILLADRVIRLIKEQTQKEINDYIYVTLTDHIYSTVERIKNNIIFDDTLLLNVKGLYKEEYEIALKAVEMIRNSLDIKLNNSEASFIALHILNAEMNSEMEKTYEITSILEEIQKYVSEHFQSLKNETAYDRFIIHCRFLLQGIEMEKVDNKISIFSDMLNELKEDYQGEMVCVKGIADIIRKRKNYQLSNDEMFYLLIHLARLS